VIEALRTSILVPHDHLHINQKRAFLAPRRVRGGVQINRFGITPVELLGNWVTDHNEASVMKLGDPQLGARQRRRSRL
jgi:hypothetical protein